MQGGGAPGEIGPGMESAGAGQERGSGAQVPSVRGATGRAAERPGRGEGERRRARAQGAGAGEEGTEPVSAAREMGE